MESLNVGTADMLAGDPLHYVHYSWGSSRTGAVCKIMYLVKTLGKLRQEIPWAPGIQGQFGNYHEALSISVTIFIAVMKFLEKATQGRVGFFWLTGGRLTVTMVGEAGGRIVGSHYPQPGRDECCCPTGFLLLQSGIPVRGMAHPQAFHSA